MARDAWLERHPYLRPLARLDAEIGAALARVAPLPPPAMPDWDAYRSDFLAGVPLLSSGAVDFDFEPANRSAHELIERLRARPLGGLDLAALEPGLLCWLGWICAARQLQPLLDEYAKRRDEERWLRNRCPTCGAPPSMAQLVGVDPGRMRFLVCGACTTRWRYSRTGCPFCEVDTRRIAIVTIEGEGGLRLDHCESCRAYLKTYDGQGSEALLLADWTSLHLDVLAQDRGLVRRAASFFDFAAGISRPPPRVAP